MCSLPSTSCGFKILVLPTGNDPVLLHYQCSVIPLYYESGNPLAALPLPLFLPFQVGVIP